MNLSLEVPNGDWSSSTQTTDYRLSPRNRWAPVRALAAMVFSWEEPGELRRASRHWQSRD